MPVTIELPDGASATLRSSDELTNKMVKELRRAARKVGLSVAHLKELGWDDKTRDEDAPEPSDEETAAANASALSVFGQLSDEEDDNLDLFQRTCAAVRFLDWTLDLPHPKTADDVDNLPRPIYEALTGAAAKLDLNESFEKTPETQMDPPVATPGSDA
jgi:hypothetical protein